MQRAFLALDTSRNLTLAGQIIMEGFLNIRIRPWLRRLVTRALIAWDVSIVVYLVLAFTMMAGCGIDYIRRKAVLQDDGSFLILLVTGAGAFASIAAIVAELARIGLNVDASQVLVLSGSQQALDLGIVDPMLAADPQARVVIVSGQGERHRHVRQGRPPPPVRAAGSALAPPPALHPGARRRTPRPSC